MGLWLGPWEYPRGPPTHNQVALAAPAKPNCPGSPLSPTPAGQQPQQRPEPSPSPRPQQALLAGPGVGADQALGFLKSRSPSLTSDLCPNLASQAGGSGVGVISAYIFLATTCFLEVQRDLGGLPSSHTDTCEGEHGPCHVHPQPGAMSLPPAMCTPGRGPRPFPSLVTPPRGQGASPDLPSHTTCSPVQTQFSEIHFAYETF